MKITRRNLITSAASSVVFPAAAIADTAREITWDDLVPPGVPFSEIIGEGVIDEKNDFWQPIYDENATKLNTALNGAFIKMPGFIIPIDVTAKGVTSFVLVPYVGACIHTPPPPPNQLVFATTDTPWPGDDLWEAVWVTGWMHAQLQTTGVGEPGYTLTAVKIELYVW